MRQRLPAAVIVCLVASSLGFAARAQPIKAPAIVSVPGSIRSLLDDYGTSYRAKDRARLERTLGPPLAESELKAFDNAKDVPFRSFVVRPVTEYSGNLAYSRVRALYPGKQVATYHVTEATALDIESVPYEEDGAYTFVRDAPKAGDPYDGWRLVSKSDLDALAFFSPYHLWDAGPVSILRSAHFALLTHPEVAEEMRPVLDVAEQGYAKATTFWPRTVNERYVIVVPATTEELGDMIHATIDLQKFVAFVASGADQTKGWQPTGPRLFVHLAHFRNYAAQGRLEIVAHELIHAITRPITGPHIPSWIEEGLANTGGGAGGRTPQPRAGSVSDEFPTDDQFTTGPVEQIMLRYDQSQVAIQVLIDRFGREGLARFYETLGSARVVPGTDTYHVREAVAKALHWTEDAWIAAWHERLK